MRTLEELRFLTRGNEDFAEIDRVLGEFLLRLCTEPLPEVYLAGVLASRAVRSGDSCANLAACGRIFEAPELSAWLAALRRPGAAKAVTVLERTGEIVIPVTPLVADWRGRCYLQRYFQFEHSVAADLVARAALPAEIPELDKGSLAALAEFFPDAAHHPEPDFQQWAVWNGIARHLTVLSGGPGTGKTTVAAALVALELTLRPHSRVALAAPTGKAQARLLDSMRRSLAHLRVGGAVRESMMKLEAGTIHALLGARRNSHEFVHRADNLLECDLMIVDECSMVPLNLMARLLEALPRTCRLVLLGDRRQLASVEAGAVMADLCDAGRSNAGNAAVAESFARQTGWTIPEDDVAAPLSGCVVELTENHRFDRAAPLLGKLAGAIRDLPATPAAAESLAREIRDWRGPEFCFIPAADAALERRVAELAKKERLDGRWRLLDLPGLAADGGAEARRTAFALLESFRMLAPQIQGRRGVKSLNEMMCRVLHLPNPVMAGVPVLIRENAPALGLFNGDTGIFAHDPVSGRLRAFFPGMGRSYLPGELPPFETVFAMTVHKSQVLKPL